MLPLWRMSDWLQRKDSRQPGSEHTSRGSPQGLGFWQHLGSGISRALYVLTCETCRLWKPVELSGAKALAHLQGSYLTSPPPLEGGYEVLPASSVL